jgi:hypothetical protein
VSIGLSDRRSRLPGGHKFSFDYEPREKSRVSADEILDSMNRSLQVGEMLDYDPQMESYLTTHKSAGSARGPGRLVFALMLLIGIVVAWFYGGLTRFLDPKFWRSGFGILGYAVPMWLIGAGAFLFLLLVAAGSRSGKTLEITQ